LTIDVDPEAFGETFSQRAGQYDEDDLSEGDQEAAREHYVDVG
jgi:hypothetical protein